MTKNSLQFFVRAKSVLAEPVIFDEPLSSGGMPVTQLVKPRGATYHIKRDFQLRDDDWVIFGVASTSDVDLVDEIIDAEYVFSESLEEFINTGRIFWEHGYKLAGKVDADNPITSPIGVPYLVEVFNNELLVYIVLDKSHPTSQMIWSRLNQEDNRFSKQIGLSIGAIPLGVSSKTKDTKTGNYVKKCPKMRLYEISVTGQPINPHTWTEVVKSFLANEMEDVMSKANTKNVATKKKVTKAIEDEVPMEEPMAEEPVMDEGAGMEDVGAEMASVGDEGMGEEPMPMEEPAMEPDMGAEMPMDEGLGEADAGGMLDMMGEGEMGLDEAPEPEPDVATDVTLDKLDMLTSMVSELLEVVKTSSDVADITDSMDIGEEPEPVDSEPVEDEEEPLDEIRKSLANNLDKSELALEYLPQILSSTKSLMKEIKSLNKRISDMEDKFETKSVGDEVLEETKGESNVKSARKTFEEENAAETTKSVGSEEEKKTSPVTKAVSGQMHPGKVSAELDDATTPNAMNDEDAVIKSIIANKDKLELATELVGAWKSLYGTPTQVAEKKEKIFRIAAEDLGLSRSSFKSMANQVITESDV